MLFIPIALDSAVTIGAYMAAGHNLAESYPLFVLLGGFWGIIGTAVVACLNYFMVTWYAKRGEGECWLVISIVCWTLLARILAIWNNIEFISHPVSYEVASTSESYSAAAKISAYYWFVGLFVLLPIFIQYLSYRLLKVKYKLVTKDDG